MCFHSVVDGRISVIFHQAEAKGLSTFLFPWFLVPSLLASSWKHTGGEHPRSSLSDLLHQYFFEMAKREDPRNQWNKNWERRFAWWKVTDILPSTTLWKHMFILGQYKWKIHWDESTGRSSSSLGVTEGALTFNPWSVQWEDHLSHLWLSMAAFN